MQKRSVPTRRTAPGRSPTKRLTLDLSREEHQALKLISVERDLPMADLLRGVIAELRSDRALLNRVVKRAD